MTLLPRADLAFGWSYFMTRDKRFLWQGEIDFDFDVIDYGAGRLALIGRYEAVLGHERRLYDVNHGNYAFDVVGSYRVGSTEVMALAHHVSRHLTDRELTPAISWNLIGARVRHQHLFEPAPADAIGASDRLPPARLEAEIDMGAFTHQAFVDYTWRSRARVTYRQPISPSVSLIASGMGELIGVNHDLAGRDNLCGGRIEGGLRFRGGAADLEVFAAYERRIDAYPTDRSRARLTSIGFRLVTR